MAKAKIDNRHGLTCSRIARIEKVRDSNVAIDLIGNAIVGVLMAGLWALTRELFPTLQPAIPALWVFYGFFGLSSAVDVGRKVWWWVWGKKRLVHLQEFERQLARELRSR